MRIAVLSDIHGNLPALEAVLSEVEHEAVDRIVLNGDIAAGPLPRETLDRLTSLGDRAVWVRGNGERAIVAGCDGQIEPGMPAHLQEQVLATGRLISPAQRDLLADLPLTVTLAIDGLGTALFCHATPRRDDEILLVDSPVERFATALSEVPSAVNLVVVGHTHMPYARLVAGRWVVNPGSVGMPYGHAGAAWALLGPAIDLRRTAYDVEAAAARLRNAAWPGADTWVENYVLRQATDIEALQVFGRMAEDERA
jgi:predicted phosphodiesterase